MLKKYGKIWIDLDKISFEDLKKYEPGLTPEKFRQLTGRSAYKQESFFEKKKVEKKDKKIEL
jgi:hypothetical protein